MFLFVYLRMASRLLVCLRVASRLLKAAKQSFASRLLKASKHRVCICVSVRLLKTSKQSYFLSNSPYVSPTETHVFCKNSHKSDEISLIFYQSAININKSSHVVDSRPKGPISVEKRRPQASTIFLKRPQLSSTEPPEYFAHRATAQYLTKRSLFKIGKTKQDVGQETWEYCGKESGKESDI